MNLCIYLIRHGLSVANINKIITGYTDTPLALEGIEKLYSLKKEVKYPQADLYFSSPLIRAIDTMKILYGDIEYSILEGFKELNFGVYEGLPFAREDEFRDLLLSGGKVEDGESLIEFRNRVMLEFKNLCELLMIQKKQSAIVFCHSLVMRSVLGYFDNYETHEFSDVVIENGRGLGFNIEYGQQQMKLINKFYF